MVKKKNSFGINVIFSMPSQLLFCLEPQTKDFLNFLLSLIALQIQKKVGVLLGSIRLSSDGTISHEIV